ncbi:hypothetical protein KY363_04910, partial [Candidatus Woesearchaeota archaeon]|nr:hypothetical protein [Candidatus Woesearchaeota archaeon]
MSGKKNPINMLVFIIAAALLSSAVFAAAPNPGHTASQISGGTFSANDGMFTFPQNVTVVNALSVSGGSLDVGGFMLPLSVGNGTEAFGIVGQGAYASVTGLIDNNTWDGGGVMGTMKNITTDTDVVSGTLATYRTGSGAISVYGRNRENSGADIVGFLANKSVAVYGNTNGIANTYAGYFVGNVSSTVDFCIPGKCLSS